jgi:hypothetical protein
MLISSINVKEVQANGTVATVENIVFKAGVQINTKIFFCNNIRVYQPKRLEQAMSLTPGSSRYFLELDLKHSTHNRVNNTTLKRTIKVTKIFGHLSFNSAFPLPIVIKSLNDVTAMLYRGSNILYCGYYRYLMYKTSR